MSKKLQKDSKYAMADADGDGIVTDQEMDRHAMWVRLENEDKQADTQRLMAWISMGVSIVTVIILLTPIINITRMESASGFLNTFLVAQMGVVLGFMGATALSKTKMKQESGMATYVNDLRLTEIATGDETGDWGDITNTNLELVAEAFSFGTEAITTNADTHTTTIADGATDPGRSIFLKYTGTLDSACTITIGPNTVSKLWLIENGTSGSQNIIISSGSGANITIPPGDTKAVYSDGAGSGAAMVDAFASLSVVDLKVQDDLTVTDDLIVNGDIDLEGSIDVNGTANLDVVDIDGAVDMATTLQVDGVATFTGRDIHSGGITIANAGQIGSVGDADAIAIASDGVVTLTQKLIGTELDISGNIDVDGTANLDVVDIDGAVDMATTLSVTGNVTLGGQLIMPDVTSTKMLVADGTSYQEVSISGDVTIANTGAVTIAANAVEGSMLNNNVISGQTALTSGLATDDELLVSDGGTLKRMDVSVLTTLTDDNATALAIALG